MYANFSRKFPVGLSVFTAPYLADIHIGVTEDIFKLGSTSPASVLLDAVDQLDKKSPKADENIQLIRPNLPDAVAACVQAAGQEYSTHWQKQNIKQAT